MHAGKVEIQAVRSDDLSNGLVLVVDDEESIRRTLSGVLQDEGFTTITASNGVDTCEKIREFCPDVVFLDIWMPGWDGVETLEKIKEINPDIEVVMISGHATIANALEAQRRGAFDFIEKPLDIENIVTSASRALERRIKNTQHSKKVSFEKGTRKNYSGNFSHPGMLTKGLAGNNLGQRTLADGIILYGQGLHSGRKSGLVLEPLPKDSGIHFAKMGGSNHVPAHVDYVNSTAFATRVQYGDIAVATIEHLMSALHAYGISNLLIKCNEEVPIFDGSSLRFCEVIEQVGIDEQGGDWYEIAIDKTYEVVLEGGEKVKIEPADTFSVAYELNYPSPVGHQVWEFEVSGSKSYFEHVAPARTFGFIKDIEKLQKAGLAAGGRLDNFILIGNDGIVNTELRFANELVRHKVLDAIGDLFLLGRPLRGKVTASMTGHSDNIQLIRQILPHC